MVWLPDVKKSEDTINSFDRIHERERRTIKLDSNFIQRIKCSV